MATTDRRSRTERELLARALEEWKSRDVSPLAGMSRAERRDRLVGLLELAASTGDVAAAKAALQVHMEFRRDASGGRGPATLRVVDSSSSLPPAVAAEVLRAVGAPVRAAWMAEREPPEPQDVVLSPPREAESAEPPRDRLT